MSGNYFLLWIVIVSTGLVVIRALRRPGTVEPGWFKVNLSIMIVTLVLVWQFFELAGYVGGGLWLLCVLAPALLIRRLTAYLYQHRYGAAIPIARAVWWLHPFNGYRSLPQLLHALDNYQRGDEQHAQELLLQLSSMPGSIASTAIVQYFVLNSRWTELKEWVERKCDVHEGRLERHLILYYVRALGELREVDMMIDVFQRYSGQLQSLGGFHFASCAMVVLAFCGEVELLERLLSTRLDRIPEDVKSFWRATAQWACGANFAANEVFVPLTNSSIASVRSGAAQRMYAGVAQFDTQASRTSKELLQKFLKSYQKSLEAHAELYSSLAHPLMTYLLILANVIMFGIEVVSGGSTDPHTLFRLGALLPEAAYRFGEWWRVFAAFFLHYGHTHLFANMVGLYLLGPFVERVLGRKLFLACYICSGAGSLVLITCLTSMGFLEPSILVGASGAVMGLVGATAAIFLRSWRRYAQAESLQQMKSVGFIIVLQTVFDLATPQVSFMAHISGVALGLIITALMLRTPDRSLDVDG